MLKKVSEQFNYIENLHRINILGDPGCDGLGASTMSVFAKALSSVDSDISLIVGDIVPVGEDLYYKNITSFINSVSTSPVYCLKGNHDTKDYESNFGLSNYLLYSEHIKIICLDNSKRDFDESSLLFLKTALEFKPELNVIISFHYPPPNSVHLNSINMPEWDKIREIYYPYVRKIKYFISGHLHSYFEEEIDGVKIIVTGGAGAQIEFVNDKIDQSKAAHHIVQISCVNCETTEFHHIRLDSKKYTREIEDEVIYQSLEKAFSNECMAHVKYRIYAEDSLDNGYPNLSKLFMAISDAEYYHAKNHFFSLEKDKTLLEYIEDSIDAESYEVNTMYKEFLEYSKENNHGLASYSFFDALEAEKIHEMLLQKAKNIVKIENDIERQEYSTCTSCGYTFACENLPLRCPICGAPHDRIKRVDSL